MNNSLKTDLKRRVIPVILLSNYQVVKSREFGDYRTFGNLEQTITVFNYRNVDEIIVLDIDASKNKTNLNIDLLKILSANCLMPFSYGGGIRTTEDIGKCLLYGCEKVIINTKCLENSNFINEASKVFGNQCIVVSLDYIKKKENWSVFSHSDINTKKINIKKYIADIVNQGAGELLITSVNQDGHLNGYDLSFYSNFCNDIRIPILINGGCSNPHDIVEPYTLGIDGFCASSIFYYTQYSYKDIKEYLINKNLDFRPA